MCLRKSCTGEENLADHPAEETSLPNEGNGTQDAKTYCGDEILWCSQDAFDQPAVQIQNGQPAGWRRFV